MTPPPYDSSPNGAPALLGEETQVDPSKIQDLFDAAQSEAVEVPVHIRPKV